MAATKFLTLAVLAGSVTLGAYALASSPARAVPADANPPSAAAPATATPPAPDHPDADAQAKGLFENACSSCHDASLATQAKQTPAQWADTVATMVSRGAPLDDKQAAEVSDYLARHYSGG